MPCLKVENAAAVTVVRIARYTTTDRNPGDSAVANSNMRPKKRARTMSYV